MAERFSCALASLALREPCYGTASQVRRWILVEQPGGWGAEAVVESRLPGDVAGSLQEVARAVGARLLLIRRHGRTEPQRRSCYAAVTTQRVRRIERISFDDPRELLAVDWSPLRSLGSVGAEAIAGPAYLVCTNGSHDPCCAVFGRPVAQALSAEFGESVWEVSHVGGDRFAGNVVCLPDGVYYGRITSSDAVRVITEHEAGRIALPHYRGRSYLAFAAQAAEVLLREELDLIGLEEVVAERVEPVDQDTLRVSFRTPGGPATATVCRTEALEPQLLTCGSGSEERPPRYRLVSLS